MSRTLYFALQRLRGQVRPEQVLLARRLLDSDRRGIQDHVRRRLEVMYGPATRNPDWLSQLPLVTRSSLIEPHRALIASHPSGVEVRKTSGSTGTPFHFVKDKEMTSWMDAAMWAAYAWHGIAPGDRRLRFWGMPLAGKTRWRRRAADLLTRQLRLSAFAVTPRDCASFFARARRFRAGYAYGYPALMALWAAECQAQNLDGRELNLRVVIATGELLPPETRRFLSTFFGCPVFNEYGCSESGVLALECTKGTAHTLPVAALAEIVRPDGSRCGPGEVGEVIVTDLFGRHLPMLRYRLHDLAKPTVQMCECGRALEAYEILMGRQDSFIQLPDGRQVYDAILAYSVPRGISGFRAFQLTPHQLRAHITIAQGIDPAEIVRSLTHAWRDALGTDIELAVEVVPTLPFEHSGKLRYFVPMGSGIQS